MKQRRGFKVVAGDSGSMVKIEGVIFDLDGLVLDTEEGYWSAWKQAGETMGHPLPDDLRRFLDGRDSGGVRRGFVNHFGHGFDWAEFSRRSREAWYGYIREKGIPVQRGLRGLVSLLLRERIPYCIATNSYRCNAIECIRFADLHGVFDSMVTREDVRSGKPAPDLFFLASEVLGVGINRCLVLEDSLSGLVGAKVAGALTAFVPSVRPVDGSVRRFADEEFRDLEEVSEFLVRLRS